MGRLSVYLPPFAGDYSGVCSALFDLNCLIVLCDAKCCTKNYIDYDEPRWSREATTTLCARLTTLEVTLGDDRWLIDQTVEAAETRRPEFIAMLGSPVPAIVGMDMAGIAREVEERTGISSFGFATTGFSSYRKGVEMALHTIYRHFVDRNKERCPGTVNILGATPLDLGAVGNDRALREAVERAGFLVKSVFLMGSSLEQLREAGAAEVNLVVSAAGLSLAREMERELQIPYAAWVPLGGEGAENLGKRLRRAAETGISQEPEESEPSEGSGEILMVGDLVLVNSLRQALRARGCVRPIRTGSFFVSDADKLLPGDFNLQKEADLIGLLRSGRFTTLVGDPLLAGIPDSGRLKFFSLPHPAVSGCLHWDEVRLLTGWEMDRWMETILRD